MTAVRIRQGETYSYERRGKGGKLLFAGRYKLLRFALDPVQFQEKVVHEGVEGPDVGRLFVCSKADFANKFLPAGEPEPTQEQPAEKVAGYQDESWRM